MKSSGRGWGCVNPRHTCTHSPCSTPLSSWSAVGCWMSSRNKHNLQKDRKEDKSKENGGRQERREMSAITVRSLECWIWTIIWHGNSLKHKYPTYVWLITYTGYPAARAHTHTHLALCSGYSLVSPLSPPMCCVFAFVWVCMRDCTSFTRHVWFHHALECVCGSWHCSRPIGGLALTRMSLQAPALVGCLV